MACYSTRGAQLSSGLRCACHSSPQRPGTISNEASVPQNLFGWAECLPEQFGPSFSDLALGGKCRVKLSKDLVRIIDFQILHQPNSPRDESSWPFRANVLRSTAGSRRAPKAPPSGQVIEKVGVEVLCPLRGTSGHSTCLSGRNQTSRRDQRNVRLVPQHTPITIRCRALVRRLGVVRRRVQLLLVNWETARAKLVKLASKAHIFDTGPPDVGADGKDYRANSVHAPFPDKSQRGAPPCGLKARSFQVAASRLVTPRGTS